MPIIHSFDGIKILIFSKDHNPPHFHVYYGDYHALIEIENLQILKGDLPNKQYQKTRDWAITRKAPILETFKNLNPDLR